MALLPGSGGSGGMDELKDDATPELGGPLDVDGQIITSSDNGNVEINPNGTGDVVLGNFTFDGDQSVGAGQDNYVLTYDNASGTIGLEVSTGGISDVVEDTTPQLGGDLDLNGNGIDDTNGNEMISFVASGSAVNNISVANAVSTAGPSISAVGDDTNVDLRFFGKGTGNIVLGNYTFDVDQTVGAGQDDYVMTYNDSTGLISLEAASGGSGGGVAGRQIDSWTAGDFLHTHISGDTRFNFTFSADTMYAIPLYIPASFAADQVGINVQTAAGGTNVRIGLYESSNGRPGALAADFGVVSSATTGAKTISISQTFDGGFYFAVFLSDGGPGISAATGNSITTPFLHFATVGFTGQHVMRFTRSFTYAALPASFGSATADTNNNLPCMWLRKS